MGWILYTGIPDCPSHKSYVNEGIFKQGIQSQIPCAADAIQQRIHVILKATTTSLTERGTTYGKIDFAERGCQITGD